MASRPAPPAPIHSNAQNGVGDCPFCPFTHPDIAVLSRHVEHHVAILEDQKPSQAHHHQHDSLLAQSMAGPAVDGDTAGAALAAAAAQQPAPVAPGTRVLALGLSASAESVVPNVIRLLKAVYSNARLPGLKKFYLASEMDHHSASEWQHGWACGFLNLANMLSSLLRHKPVARRLSAAGIIETPTVLELQHRIEQAWSDGYDPASGRELGDRLAGQTKWIGANEVAAVLRSLGVRCELVDFDTSSLAGKQLFFDWTFEYFARRTRLLGRTLEAPFVAPLFLQYPGHSMTIVGCELFNNKRSLLVLDVTAEPIRVLRRHKRITCRHSIDSHLFSKGRYQVVAVDHRPLYASASEQMAAKHILNKRPVPM